MWLRKQKTTRLHKKKVDQVHGEDIVSYDTYSEFRATINRLRGDEYERLPEALRHKSLFRVLYKGIFGAGIGDRLTTDDDVYVAVGDEENFITHSEVIVEYEN